MQALEITVRRAARALSRAGLVGAYGHCSARIDGESLLVCAAKPMGLIEPGEPGTIVPIVGSLPEGVLGEVRMHQKIYEHRPDVHGICRVVPPKVMSLSALRLTPRVRHGFGSYFAPQPPLWDNPMLIRSDALAEGVAATLGGARAIVLRGNGAVTAGTSLEEAVVLAWYLEDAARIELDVLHANGGGDPQTYTEDEAAERAVWAGRVVERMWSYLCRGDPE